MLDLSTHKAPFDIALPYGLTVTVKPLTTAGMAAAQAAARRDQDLVVADIRPHPVADPPKAAGIRTRSTPGKEAAKLGKLTQHSHPTEIVTPSTLSPEPFHTTKTQLGHSGPSSRVRGFIGSGYFMRWPTVWPRLCAAGASSWLKRELPSRLQADRAIDRSSYAHGSPKTDGTKKRCENVHRSERKI